MKKFILILSLFVLSNTFINAQDKEPEIMKFYNPVASNTFVYDIRLPEYQQDKFMLGWQWGGHQ